MRKLRIGFLVLGIIFFQQARGASRLLIEFYSSNSSYSNVQEFTNKITTFNNSTNLKFALSDVDECASDGLNTCSQNANCTNLQGSFTCACHEGYYDERPTNPGRNCSDVNECESNPCTGDTTCSNTVGSYLCPCKEGYRNISAIGLETLCEDVDECTNENNCSTNAVCSNTIGSYTCDCTSGFVGDGFVCKEDSSVDHCQATSSAPCPKNSVCINLKGGYKCACHPGFVLAIKSRIFSCIEKANDTLHTQDKITTESNTHTEKITSYTPESTTMLDTSTPRTTHSEIVTTVQEDTSAPTTDDDIWTTFQPTTQHETTEDATTEARISVAISSTAITMTLSTTNMTTVEIVVPVVETTSTTLATTTEPEIPGTTANLPVTQTTAPTIPTTSSAPSTVISTEPTIPTTAPSVASSTTAPTIPTTAPSVASSTTAPTIPTTSSAPSTIISTEPTIPTTAPLVASSTTEPTMATPTAATGGTNSAQSLVITERTTAGITTEHSYTDTTPVLSTTDVVSTANSLSTTSMPETTVGQQTTNDPNTTASSTSTTNSGPTTLEMENFLDPLPENITAENFGPAVENLFKRVGDFQNRGTLTADDGFMIANQLQALLDASIPIKTETANMLVGIVGVFADAVDDTVDPKAGSMITSFVSGMLEALVLNVSEPFVKMTSTMDLEAVKLPGEEFQMNGLDFKVLGEQLVDLPGNLVPPNQENLQVAFTRYTDARLFNEPGFKALRAEDGNTTLRDVMNNDKVVNSPVVAASIKDNLIQNSVSPVAVTLPLLLTPMIDEFQNGTKKNYRLVDKRCVWWNYTANNGTGAWSEFGCAMTESPNNSLVCECNHLTSFAAIMRISVSVEDTTLTMLSIVGCSISILGLLITIITYSVFKTLRKNKSKKILIHFCVALCGVYVTYLLGIATRLPKNQEQCIAAIFFLHYFLMAVIAWMLVEVLDMYLIFVKIWGNVQHHMLKAVIGGWVLPLLIALVTLGVHFAVDSEENTDHRIYTNYDEDAVCWLGSQGAVYGFLIPSCLVLMANLIIFSIVVYSITCKQWHTKVAHVQASKRRVKASRHIINAFALLLLVGPTWIIGYLVNISPGPDEVLNRIFSYIFVLLNAFQGLWIFIMFSIRPRIVRRLWYEAIFKRQLLHSAISSPSQSLSHGRHTHSTTAGRIGKVSSPSSPVTTAYRGNHKKPTATPRVKNSVTSKVSFGSSQSSTKSSNTLLKAGQRGNLAAFHENYLESRSRPSSPDTEKSMEVEVTIESRDTKNPNVDIDDKKKDEGMASDEDTLSLESRSSTPKSTSKILK